MMQSEGLYYSYDKNRRAKEIMEKLDSELEALGKRRRNEEQNKMKGKKSENGDITQVYIDEMGDKANLLEKDIEDFEGPHFNKLFRTLESSVADIQVKLDAIDVTGREDIRKKRKEILDKLNTMSDHLLQKLHKDGQHCPKCELQKI